MPGMRVMIVKIPGNIERSGMLENVHSNWKNYAKHNFGDFLGKFSVKVFSMKI